MRKSWWKKQGELDEHQKQVVTLETEGRYVLTGPPGSGKTNLLLLRAMFLSSAGLKDVLFLTVGRTLQEFIVTGVGNRGLVATDQVMTFRKWTMKHLAEHSPRFMKNPPTGSYDEKRASYAAELGRVSSRLAPMYSAILIDEVQDFNDQEFRAVSALTQRMMVAGDDRQRIYTGGEGLGVAAQLGFTPIELEYHYRIGLRICEAADAVLPPPRGGKPLAQTCNYDEAALPSSRKLVRADGFETQVRSAAAEIAVQLKAYPGEAFGIFVPNRSHVAEVKEILDSSELAALCAYHDGESDTSREFPEDKQIFVMTIHSAKGTEFRAVHVLASDGRSRHLSDRRVVFTAFTRAKTSLAVYHSGRIARHIEAAFAKPHTPKLEELF